MPLPAWANDDLPQEAITQTESGTARWDTWSGVIATPETSFGYGGLTYALNGDKNADGWRIRLQGGGGLYNYTSNQFVGTTAVDITFLGQSTTGEAMAGYQWRSGEFTAKVFAGLAYRKHVIGPPDPDNPVVGEKYGGAFAAEGWLNVGDMSFASFDLSFATPFASYSGQARYGHAVWDNLWFGVELGGYGNAELDAARAGLFGRWQTSYGTLWLAGGVSGDYDDPSTPYGRLTYVKSF